MKSIRGGNKNQVEAMSMDDLGTVSLIPQTETGFHDTGFQERRRIQERNRMCQANRRQIRQNAAFMEQTEGELQGRQKKQERNRLCQANRRQNAVVREYNRQQVQLRQQTI